MRLVINIALVALIGLFIWLLISGIREPILFNSELKKRETAVTDRLKEIRSAQKIYSDVMGGSYAQNFDTLVHVLRTGRIPTVKVIGDPDDPTNLEGVTYDTTWRQAIEDANALSLNLDSLQFVPYADKGTVFEIYADTITYQSTMVNVVEVGVNRAKYMGKFADPKYKRYDDGYDPTAFIKFGNKNAPNTTGNWE
ncbi:MAG: hypothetical protein HKN16_00075 [Saprospiraceae bacterium]|nr:hypothetical protein [Saprospiraceae bacterium]